MLICYVLAARDGYHSTHLSKPPLLWIPIHLHRYPFQTLHAHWTIGAPNAGRLVVWICRPAASAGCHAALEDLHPQLNWSLDGFPSMFCVVGWSGNPTAGKFRNFETPSLKFWGPLHFFNFFGGKSKTGKPGNFREMAGKSREISWILGPAEIFIFF